MDSSREMEKSFLEARSKIKIGKTNSSQVQEIFGTPYLANRKLQLEVYRLAAEDRAIMVANFFRCLQEPHRLCQYYWLPMIVKIR